MAHLQRENTSFLTAQLAEDFADLVFTCPIAGGSALVALLLEHKSWAPRYPHLQLLSYMLGVWEQSEKDGRPLPPIIPIVLYNGQGAWKVREFASCFPDLPDRLLPFLPEFRFLLLDLAHEPPQTSGERFHNRSVCVALELMRAISPPSEVTALMQRLTPADGPPDRDLAFRFLRVVLRYIFTRSDVDQRDALNLALNPEIRRPTMTLEEQILQRGELRGLERGARAAKIEDARKMREHGIDWATVTDVTGVTPADLQD